MCYGPFCVAMYCTVLGWPPCHNNSSPLSRQFTFLFSSPYKCCFLAVPRAQFPQGRFCWVFPTEGMSAFGIEDATAVKVQHGAAEGGHDIGSDQQVLLPPSIIAPTARIYVTQEACEGIGAL